ncbi:MAG: L,D-transpeptidase [Actinomycetota bacterium]|nr:L,D-transpeptidase [Actinomycetota bacterium]
MSVSVAITLLVLTTWGVAGAGKRHPGKIVGIKGNHCAAWSYHHVGNGRIAYAGIARHSLKAYRRAGRAPFARFKTKNVNGVPTVLGIRGAIVSKRCKPLWYRVQLPRRPNGIRAYVRASAVQVGNVRTRIVVDLSERQLTFFRNGRARLTTRVAIGSSATPTPRGRFYVNQRLVSADKSGPFGPAALGISAFSPVLTGWTQGGPIAIHGTNQPRSIGRAMSNGCIRVRNGALRRLFAKTPMGSPVLVRR